MYTKASVISIYFYFLLVWLLTACTPVAPSNAALNTATKTISPGATSVSPLTITTSPTPTISLPRSIYYMAMDANQKFQIFRIDRDIVSNNQVTFESAGVKNFDVSPVDGTLAYYTGNQLVLADSHDINREVIYDNTDPARKSMSSVPRFSPDGQMIAYGQFGNIYFYSIKTKTSSLEIRKDSRNYYIYYNSEFSPDGSKLIVRFPNIGIYDLSTKTVHDLHRLPLGLKGEIFGHCNNTTYWSSDSKSLYFTDWTTGNSCVSEFGLYRFGMDGMGISLFPWEYKQDTKGASIASLWQENNDEILYLYSSKLPSYFLARSTPDDIEHHINLRPEEFHVSLVPPKWTPDGKALVLVQADDMQSNHITSMILIPVDSSLPVVPILLDVKTIQIGNGLRWGP